MLALFLVCFSCLIVLFWLCFLLCFQTMKKHNVPCNSSHLFDSCWLKGSLCYCSVWWFCMVTKQWHVPKTDSVKNKCAFFTFRTQIVFANFSKKCHFKNCSQTSKTLFFCIILKFPFICVFIFSLFLSPTWKRQKQKKALLGGGNLLLHPTTSKKYFRTRTHYLWLKKPPTKLGKQANNLWSIVDANLDQFLNQKPQMLDQFSTLQRIKTMCIYTHILESYPTIHLYPKTELPHYPSERCPAIHVNFVLQL